MRVRQHVWPTLAGVVVGLMAGCAQTSVQPEQETFATDAFLAQFFAQQGWIAPDKVKQPLR